MEFTINLAFIVVGLLLVGMAMAGSIVSRLPVSTGMLYVVGGVLLGPGAIGLIKLDPFEHAEVLERVTEIAVIISLFTAGLKLRESLRSRRWRLSLRLAFISMGITVGLVTIAGIVGMGLPVGAAVLLGAVLAPTDPVLASDVQVREPGDRDRLRFALTSEAGLNDGTAFPFVMLGLGLLGLHELGEFGWRWFAIDVVWAIVVGLGIGALMGTLIGRLVIYLRRIHKEAVGLDDFLALGLIALSYGTALMAHSYGFLAVFAAGLAVRRIEVVSTGSDDVPADVRNAAASSEEMATHPQTAPAYMTEAVLAFNEQIERIGTLGIVVLVGAMVSYRHFTIDVLWFVPLLLLVIRPASVWVGLFSSRTDRRQRHMISWFGVRGIGSVYYLMFAIVHGLEPEFANKLITLTLSTIAVSVVLHGISVTPLMQWYESVTERERSLRIDRTTGWNSRSRAKSGRT